MSAENPDTQKPATHPNQPAVEPEVHGQPTPTIFGDMVLSVNIVNGVARIAFGAVGPDNKVHPTGRVMLPLSELPGVARIFANTVNELAARSKKAKEEGAAQPKPEEATAGANETTH